MLKKHTYTNLHLTVYETLVSIYPRPKHGGYHGFHLDPIQAYKGNYGGIIYNDFFIGDAIVYNINILEKIDSLYGKYAVVDWTKAGVSALSDVLLVLKAVKLIKAGAGLAELLGTLVPDDLASAVSTEMNVIDYLINNNDIWELIYSLIPIYSTYQDFKNCLSRTPRVEFIYR